MGIAIGEELMKTTKHKGIWPLPGGTISYVKSLSNILDKIYNENPTFDDLLAWFIAEYNLSGVETPRSMLLYIIRFGFFSEVNEKMVLSKESVEFMKTKNKALVYDVLNKSVLGIEDVLILLNEHKKLMLKKINEWFVNKYDVNWGTTAQASFRVNWLRSLGYVERRGKLYSLSTEGAKITSKLDYDKNYYKMVDFREKVPEEIKEKPPKEEPAAPVVSDNFSRDVLTAQSETTNPENYEVLITSLFSQLGFESNHVGGSGEPDVIIFAPQGFKSYRGIIDCKTGTSPIGEYRIDWLTLNDHKRHSDADYILVVGPSFAGGRLLDRAIENGITLMTSEFLLELLSHHKKMPYSFSDYQQLFDVKGLLGDTELQRMSSITNDYVHYSNIISVIFSSLIEITPSEEKLDISGLRIYLNYTKKVKCTTKDIEKCLTMLENKPIAAIRREDNYIIPLVSLETLKRKFESLANSLFS